MSDSLRHESGLVVETRGHVRVLTLDRPERRNALSSALQADLVEELLACAEDGDVRAVVLTGNGPAFCAGFDLKEIREGDRRGRAVPPADEPAHPLAVRGGHRDAGAGRRRRCSGAAVAGGFELALACDLRVAARGITLGLPEATIGMGANFGSVVLPKRIPMGIALEMLLHRRVRDQRGRRAVGAGQPARRRRRRPADGARSWPSGSPPTPRSRCAG